MSKGPESWSGGEGARVRVLGNKEKFQGFLLCPTERLRAEGRGLHFLIPQHIQQLPWCLQEGHLLPWSEGQLLLLSCLQQFTVLSLPP